MKEEDVRMTNAAPLGYLISGVTCLLLGQSPIPVGESIKEWLALGGAGILGFLLYTVLTKTLPDVMKSNNESNRLLSLSIEKAADIQKEAADTQKTTLDKIGDKMEGLAIHCAERHAEDRLTVKELSDKKD